MHKVFSRVLVSFTLMALFVLCIYGCAESDVSEVNVTETFDQTLDYADFPGLVLEDPLDQLNRPETEYYIYFYGPHCTSCIRIKPEVLTIVSELTDVKVYLVEATSLADVHPDIPLEFTPSLVQVRDGEVIRIYQNATNILVALNDLE